MRKLFIGTILVSLLGAAVIGAALAWTGSVTGGGDATAGTVGVAFYNWNAISSVVVPNAADIKVAETGFSNTGNITVQATGGSVPSINVPAATVCNGYLSGSVQVAHGDWVSPGSSIGYAYDVFLKMNADAPDDCQGKTISYDVTINVKS